MISERALRTPWDFLIIDEPRVNASFQLNLFNQHTLITKEYIGYECLGVVIDKKTLCITSESGHYRQLFYGRFAGFEGSVFDIKLADKAYIRDTIATNNLDLRTQSLQDRYPITKKFVEVAKADRVEITLPEVITSSKTIIYRLNRVAPGGVCLRDWSDIYPSRTVFRPVYREELTLTGYLSYVLRKKARFTHVHPNGTEEHFSLAENLPFPYSMKAALLMPEVYRGRVFDVEVKKSNDGFFVESNIIAARPDKHISSCLYPLPKFLQGGINVIDYFRRVKSDSTEPYSRYQSKPAYLGKAAKRKRRRLRKSGPGGQ